MATLLGFRKFSNMYPYLAQFAKETSWRCGGAYIPITSNCYKDPVTGKTNYRKLTDPKTGRVKTVKVPISYKTYRQERTAAVKTLGKARRMLDDLSSSRYPKDLTQKEYVLTRHRTDLASRTRKKHARIGYPKYLKAIRNQGKIIKDDWRKIPIRQDALDFSPEVSRSSSVRFQGTSSGVLYNVGTNAVVVGTREMDSSIAETIKRDSNLFDVLKANKIDPREFGEVNFYDETALVNGSVDANHAFIKPIRGKSLVETKIKISTAAAKAHDQILDSLPDLSVLRNRPYTSDGKGLSRAKLYKRIGYGTVKTRGNDITQVLVKIGNKTFPLAKKLIKR